MGADLRLLVPALVAWAVGAIALGWPGSRRGLAALVALGLAVALASWRRRPGKPHPQSLAGHQRARVRVDQQRARARSDRERQDGAGGVSRSRRLGAALVLAVMGLVLLASWAQDGVRRAGPVPDLAERRAIVTATLLVTGDPYRLRGTATSEPGYLVRARVVEVTARGASSRVSTPVTVRGDERWGTVRWHETVRVTGRLAPPQPGRPEVAVLRPRGSPAHVSDPGRVFDSAEHLRAGLRKAVEDQPEDSRGLLPALVIGDTSRTPDDLTDAMLATGMTHLNAVSGSNVAVVLAFALGVAAALGCPRRWRPWVAALALAWFVILARPEPSVIRAAAMGSIGLLGMSRSTRAAGLPALAGAIVVLLVIDPSLARSYGFALSTLATLGLLLFVQPWGAAVSARLPRRLSALGPAIAIPVAAQAMCAPVVVLLQGSVSLVGVVANLLAAPLVAPATIVGVVTALVAVVWPAAAEAVAWLGALPTLGIARVARVCATVPGGTAPWPDGGWGALMLAALTLLVILTGRWVAHQAARHPVLAAGLVLVLLAALTPPTIVTWPPAGWRVVHCDVGQGDAAVLATGRRSAVLVDVGPEPAAVDRCLRRLDIERLEAVILTHFHADHVEGLPGALGGRPCGQVLTTPVREPTYQVAEVERWTAARGIPLRELRGGDELRFGSVELSVWWPERRIADGSVPNNASVVIRARAGPVDALLLGDIEREAGHAILLRSRRDAALAAALRDVDVVKTPHHGSANLDEGLFAQIAAPVAVISVGAGNDYGHPARHHLAVLAATGSVVLRTDRDGDVAVTAQGDRVRAVARR
ncbi:ComEC/Rec2 family competence protein [Actinomycetota bacterium]